MTNQMDVLVTMLDEAGIPYERTLREYDPCMWSRYGKYSKNQIIYGGTDASHCKLDAICHFGSYGYEKGLLETWGPLGGQDDGYGYWDVVGYRTAEEVFAIIKKDWEESR